ncbi:MAG: hypothetical protein WD100_05935, partial [Tistlia sp.]
MAHRLTLRTTSHPGPLLARGAPLLFSLWMRSLAKRLGVLILIAAFLSAMAPQSSPLSPPGPPGAQQLHAAQDEAPAALRPPPP